MIRKLFLPLLCLFLFAAPTVHAAVYYVDGGMPNNGGNGLSWGAAKKDLQEAINVAPAGSEIWVRTGAYVPTLEPGGSSATANPRSKTFYLVTKDQKLYGGFAGWETNISQRVSGSNITTLSGNNYSFHVLVTFERTANTVIDGFTITGGRADSNSSTLYYVNGINGTGPILQASYGAGMYNYNSSPIISNCRIINNNANRDGGGVYNIDTRNPASSNPSLINCTFNNNVGGGIYNSLNSASVSGCTFSNNTDGAVFAISDDRLLTNLTVTNCTFSNNASGGNLSGGISIQNGHLTVSGCTFNNNSSGTGDGGAISGVGNLRAPNNVSVSGCNFTGNKSAHNGGAIGVYEQLSVTVTNCNFNNDTASGGYGGAISVDGANSTGVGPALALINCTFKGNKGYSGGAVFSRLANLTVAGCSIHSNRASQEGGGIYCQYSPIALTNNTVSGNSSGANGGGLFIDGGSPGNSAITNCTITANVSAQLGGGIYMWAATVITNCILNNNTGGPANRQNIYEYPVSPPYPVVSYSLIGDYNAGASNNYTSGPGIVTGDPLFVNAASPAGADGIFRTSDDGLRITCTSPARDAGTGTTPATDILGNSRVGIMDMGAYESPGTGCANIQYVDGSQSANGNGYSWISAKRDIQEAINAVGPGGEVWVKAGTYLPTLDPNGNATPTDARDKTFYVTNKDIGLYGGFTGTETLLSQRNAVTNLTNLSGDLDNGPGTNDAYHVLLTKSRTTACIVDGFTITGGRANGTGTISVSGTSFDRSRAGGIYNSNSSPSIVSSIVHNNSASTVGGGMYNATASPVITNCIFSNNTAGTNGGGMLNEASSPVIRSTTISANTAVQNGGGIHSDATSGGSITNTILSGNTGATINQKNIYKIAGGGVLTLSYSVIGDYSSTATNNYAASNILTGDPFVDVASPAGADSVFRTADDGLRLSCSSVARDAGTGTTPATDILGSPRVSTIDIGAYEFQGTSCPALMYVNSARPDNSGAGTSWATAKKDVQVAINEVAAGGEVWVKAGTYPPTLGPDGNATPANARDKAFYLITKDVKLYGGFAGTETLLSQRNPATNVTTLSGDLDGSGGTADAYHVLVTSNRTSACVVNGFTITGGRANGSGSAGFFGISFDRGRAGGMYNLDGGLTVSNCIFSNNTAGNCGGIFNVNSTSSITNCTFNGNTSGLYGGAMYNAFGAPVISNCTFNANTANTGGAGVYNLTSNASISNATFSTNAAAVHGGGIYNDGGNPVLSNIVFNSNTAIQNGGGMYNTTSSPVISNCVFNANTAGSNGGGMHNVSSIPSTSSTTFNANTATQNGGGIYSDASSGGGIINSILSGNTGGPANRQNIYKIAGAGTLTVSYTLVSDYINAPANNYTASNMLTSDPVFIDATSPAGSDGIFRTADDGLRIGCSSPARDAGTGTSLATDILGNARVGTIDIGAYEFQGTTCPTLMYVDGSRLDNSGAGTSWATAKRDIQTAINEVTAGGSVWVKSGTYLPTRDPNGNVTPTDAREKTFYITTKDVELYGGFAGTETSLTQRNASNITVLSGDLDGGSGTNDAYHVLITGNRTTASVVDGFTISGGRANGNDSASYSGNVFTRSRGGGVYNSNSNPTITNCLITNNSSSSFAGGMYNLNASPIVTTCTFSNNVAASGSGMYNATASPTMTGCTFSNNTASVNGGGMLNDNSTPAITNCTFNTNTATTAGGGIYNVNSSFPLSGCVFSANTASSNGGGIFDLNSSPTITSCIFSANSATLNGGALYNANSASPVILNSTFSNNTATLNGGGIYNDATSGGNITNSILSGNTGATINQQNIYKIAGFGTLDISYTLIVDYNSTAPNNYTASNVLTSNPQYVNASSPAGTDGIFRTTDDGLRIACGSPARDAGTGTTPFTDILGNARAGTIDLGAYEITASGCPALVYVDRTRPDNTGAGISWATAKKDIQAGINEVASGGSVWVKSGTYLPTLDPNGNTPADARDKTFYMTTKDLKIYGGFAGTETVLTQRNVTTNLTTLSGDLDSIGGTSDAYHVLITANRTTASVVDGFTITGGQANGSSIISYSGIAFDRSKGGGVYNNNSSPTVNNCRISNNSSDSTAGGMYNVTANPIVTSCTFSSNTARSGSGMYNRAANPTITSCTFSNNTASQNGAGMLNENSSPVITSSTFNTNFAAGSGGGLYNLNSSPSISSTFTANKASINGGGIYIDGGNPTLSNCIFTNDTASQNGGAFYILNSNLSLSSSTFGTNIAGISGGGIYNNGGNPTLSTCGFIGNKATQSGGAMYNIAASPVVINCVFATGSAGINGGGMMNENSNPAISSCTFHNNTAAASGGGIYFDNNSGGSITNTILNNSTGGPVNRQNLYKEAGTDTLTVSNSIVRDYSSTATNNYTATNILTGDPLFVTPGSPAGSDGLFRTADDGLRITSCASPANNAGTGATPATDILGNTRIGLIDIGAYENQNTACPKNLFVSSSRPDNTGNGFSWATAKKDLQDAINAASAGDSIFVKAGTYLPTIIPSGSIAGDRTFYLLANDVQLYGGFAGTETRVFQRDPVTNVTILSGDLDGSSGTADAYHVMIIAGRTSACVIDGFTITGGRASSMSNASFFGRNFARDYGGGIYIGGNSPTGTRPTIRNCTIRNNSSAGIGGGIYSAGAPTISNCTFSSNTAAGSGGGFGTTTGAPVLINCDFKGNTTSQVGGGLYAANATVSATNCTFTNNTASSGGGLSNGGGSGSNVLVLSNCIFSGNVANNGGGLNSFGTFNTSTISISNCTFTANRANTNGGGVYIIQNSVVTITNSILSGNIGDSVNRQNIYKDALSGTVNVSHSLIGDYSSTATNNYTVGSGILTGNPLFIDEANPAGADSIFRTADDGLALTACSPAVNTGTIPSPALAQDILGNNRVGAYDLGAYEYQSAPTAQGVASTTTTTTRTLNRGGTALFGDCSESIAMLRSTGAKPLSGAVAATVYVQPTAPTQQQTPYVRRYYDITPAVGADTSTARITLYFTQADFDDYNAVRGSRPPLPLDTGDAAGNKINIRVTQQHGSSVSGLPGSFSGWAGAGPAIILITPDSVVWNALASRWDVTFPVTGFSGFFLHSGSAVPLPVKLLAFGAKHISESLTRVEWVTAHEDPGTQFTVERSDDAKTFKSIGVVIGQGIFTGSEYQLDDVSPLEGDNYYRLKSREPNGEEGYSNIVLVRTGKMQGAVVTVSPNPASDWVTIRCAGDTLLGSNALFMDMNGRVMKELFLEKETSVDIHQWPTGVYVLKLADGSAVRIVRK